MLQKKAALVLAMLALLAVAATPRQAAEFNIPWWVWLIVISLLLLLLFLLILRFDWSAGPRDDEQE